jgi:hypothetical protein
MVGREKMMMLMVDASERADVTRLASFRGDGEACMP